MGWRLLDDGSDEGTPNHESPKGVVKSNHQVERLG